MQVIYSPQSENFPKQDAWQTQLIQNYVISLIVSNNKLNSNLIRFQNNNIHPFISGGLIAVAQNDYREAYSFFQKSLAIDPTNALVLNNVGVCLLYLGKQKDAIGIFERAITANEQKNLSESLILNLCTLYELESSNDVSKKLALLKQLNRHSTELNINIEYCLKLPTGNK